MSNRLYLFKRKSGSSLSGLCTLERIEEKFTEKVAVNQYEKEGKNSIGKFEDENIYSRHVKSL